MILNGTHKEGIPKGGVSPKGDQQGSERLKEKTTDS